MSHDLIGRHWKEPLIALVINDLFSDVERLTNQVERSPEIMKEKIPELLRAKAQLEGIIVQLGG